MTKEERKEKIDNRIWELDAFRGILILGVIASHIVFDLQYFTHFDIKVPAFLEMIFQYGGYLFILLSGLCATLGRKTFLRGVIVFCAGIVITVVTLIMGDKSTYIFFGVLHLLGVCMMTYPLFKKIPKWPRLAVGIILIAAGLYISIKEVKVPSDLAFLNIFGFTYNGFSSGDWWPILPNLGIFLAGSFIGETLYKDKKSKFTNVNKKIFPLNFFCFCGRQSLWIYLIHQPIVYGILILLDKIIK